MNLFKVYSIRDAKGEQFTQPFLKRTHGEAERDFTTLARDEKSNVSRYPEDYDLYYLGEFNDESGKMNLLDSPQHIVKAVQCAVKQ